MVILVGLVIEGGANRTYYSVGVLDAFLDYGIDADLLVGVSAGIANGVSFISGQRGRSLKIAMEYVNDPRYMGLKYFLKKGNKSYYNRDFVFNQLPNKELPFDYSAFERFEGDVYAVVTNLKTGLPEYIEVSGEDKDWKLLQASCALPFMFPPIEIDGNSYFDGGCADPLPVEFARKRGCDKIITILTREIEYVKSAERDVEFSAFAYRRYKNFASALKNRSDVYNKSKEMLAELEKNGSAFTFAPLSTIGWSRTEKDTSKLKAMYDEGYNDAVRRMDELKKFLEN